MAKKTRTVHVRIEGLVQAVGYRAFVEMNAIEYGLDGWVRNRRDGSVEAVFQGRSDRITEMVECCRQGPSAAAVRGVTVLEEDVGALRGFEVRPTL